MVILHPDVINLSLGQLGGMDNEADSVYATVFKSLQDVGVTVNAAAGNHYTAGYGNTSGKNLPFASDPDSSTQCEPATYSSVVSVASVDNSLAHSAFTVGDRDIPFQRAGGANGQKMPDLSDLTGGPFEYVDGGIGSAEDGAALKAKYPEGLAGKIVLVKRGSLTFQTKFDNIAGSKPAGFIVYNNVPGDSLVVMSLATNGVPAAFISQADGEAMLAAADHHLSVAPGKVVAPSSEVLHVELLLLGRHPRPAPQARGRGPRRQHHLGDLERRVREFVGHLHGLPARRGHQRPRARAHRLRPALERHGRCAEERGRHELPHGDRPPAHRR